MVRIEDLEPIEWVINDSDLPPWIWLRKIINFADDFFIIHKLDERFMTVDGAIKEYTRNEKTKMKDKEP
jgi:hypothetical protein